MSWERNDEKTVDEWRREDGWATIRCRQRVDDSWVVRLDVLTQAPDGSLYREERVESRDDAEELVAAWRDEYDVADA